MLIYVGRLDREKRPDVVVEAFRRLPAKLGAQLVLIGDGPLRAEIAALGDRRIHMPGFIACRPGAVALARERRHLCLGDGRRDLRSVDHRSPGVGSANCRRVGRSDDRPGPAQPWPAWPGRRFGGDGRNILDLWKRDHAALARQAIAAAGRFDWAVVMGELFDGFYPRALGRRDLVAEARPAVAAA